VHQRFELVAALFQLGIGCALARDVVQHGHRHGSSLVADAGAGCGEHHASAVGALDVVLVVDSAPASDHLLQRRAMALQSLAVEQRRRVPADQRRDRMSEQCGGLGVGIDDAAGVDQEHTGCGSLESFALPPGLCGTFAAAQPTHRAHASPWRAAVCGQHSARQ
jgi:hypothetical protein